MSRVAKPCPESVLFLTMFINRVSLELGNSCHAVVAGGFRRNVEKYFSVPAEFTAKSLCRRPVEPV
jgi:hypothetical protein